jgi:hypothetical protein
MWRRDFQQEARDGDMLIGEATERVVRDQARYR